MPQKALYPVSYLFKDVLPADLLSAVDDAFNELAIDPQSTHFEWTDKRLAIWFRIIVLTQVRFDIPFLPGFFLQLGRADRYFQFDLGFNSEPVPEIFIRSLELTIHTPPTILQEYEETEEDGWQPKTGTEGYNFTWQTGLTANFEGKFDLHAPELSGLPPFMISDTGFIVDFTIGGDSSAAALITYVNSEPPEQIREYVPLEFKGLYIERAVIRYFRTGSNFTPTFSLAHAAIGSGGFSGTIALGTPESADEELNEEALNDESRRDLLRVQLEGMRIVLQYFGVTFTQSIPTASRIAGYMFMPFVDKWLRLEASIGGPDGEFMMELGGAGDTGLIDLDTDLFQIIVDTIRYELRKNEQEENIHYAIIKGSILPKIGDFDWPTFEVERMSISSEGDIDIDGGWVDVPETFTLDFHGFKIDIDQVGMGSEEEGARQWFGFSGGITLVEGIPLSASVQGLKFSWNTSGETDLRVSLEGIGVHLEIPNTLILDGAVRFQELEDPRLRTTTDELSTTSESAGVFGSIFTGSVMLNIMALKTQVSGELLIGDLTEYHYQVNDAGDRELVIGEKFTAFYIVLDAQLPTAIPLGATGTGLYGLTGLFGMHVAPHRKMVEDEPESWYLWYKNRKGSIAGTEYNVTKVVKWGPRYDNVAFGAGLSIGTIYDDGFTINAGALVVILIPGPVIMIEGKANLLKQRGEGGGQGAEGALYALIVFDGIAETFQMNVDINYTMEDVITVGGGMEAFFDFKDSTKWYIYIGRKEPQEKRIRAEVLSIITASAYFMIDPTVIQFGAAVGINLEYEYGPLEVKIILRLRFEIVLFLKEPQLTGLVELYLEITVKIFGIGLGIIAQALLEGSAPQPWWIHGMARFALSLPFPLPSFDVEVEFTWGETAQPARVDLLKGAYMIHPKQHGKSWILLADATAELPIVPIDAIPILSCGKPISGVSLSSVEGDVAIFDFESVEGWEFAYDIPSVALFEDGVTEPVRTNTTPGRPWLNEHGKIFQLQVEHNEGVQTVQNVVEPQLMLWDYSPLGAIHPESRKRYVDVCDIAPSEFTGCVNWRDVAEGTTFPSAFIFKGLFFITPLASPTGIEYPTASVTMFAGNNLLETERIMVYFPEPIVWFQVSSEGAVHSTCYYQGELVENSRNSTMDAVEVSIRGRTRSGTISQICYKTKRQQENESHRNNQPDASQRTAMYDTPILKANTRYRLEVTTQRRERPVGSSEFITSEQPTMAYHFRTAEAPGLNLTSEEIKALQTVPEDVQKIDFKDSPLNRLDTYLSRTIPDHGATLFYRGYRILIEFQEPYIQNLYDGELHLRIKDRNDKIILGREVEANWISSGIPFITPGLIALLKAPRQSACGQFPINLNRFNSDYLSCILPHEARPNKMYRVEILCDDRVLHLFEFSTSQYRNIIEHLESGLPHNSDGTVIGRNQLVRRGLPRSNGQPDTSWFSRLEELQHSISEERRQLWFATNWSTEARKTIEEASEDLKKIRQELHGFSTKTFSWLDQGGSHPDFPALNYAGVQQLFEAVDLGSRPLPPKVELVQIAVGNPTKYFLLLESPEPLAWERIKLKYGSNQPLRVIWNEDKTRAFIFSDSIDGLFVTGTYDFHFEFDRGGADSDGLMTLDITPLYKENDTSLTQENINWTVELKSATPVLIERTHSLDLYWHDDQKDHLSSATGESKRDAIAAGYHFIRPEGLIFQENQPETVPLELFLNTDRGDYFLTSSNKGRQDAIAARYNRIRTEGYAYSSQQPGTVPLMLYWNETRGDNFTTATDIGKRDAESAGYRFVRIEGYIFPLDS